MTMNHIYMPKKHAVRELCLKTARCGMNRLIPTVLLLTFFITTFRQSNSSFTDSIRIKYKIPELAYAVVSSDSIFELQSLGVQRVNSNFRANIKDKFRIGSNTKTILRV